MNTDTSDSDIEFTFGCPPEDLANSERPLHLIPARSAGKYDFFYNKFIQWCKEKNIEEYTEAVILEFFKQKAKTYKPSTLWAYYSMLKATLEAYHSINLGRFRKVFLFVKQQSVGYKATKSKVFTRDEVNKFLKEAPDQLYLMWKVALIMGITGGCRRKELTNMTVDDIEDFGATLMVKVPDEKTGLQRTFTITSSKDKELDPIQFYRKYTSLRPGKTPHRRLFVNYRAGKCSIQVVGVNTFGKLPSLIASYLGLPNPNRYTGHCFRRSSAALVRAKSFKPPIVTNTGEQPFDNRISMADNILQLRKIIPPIPEDSVSDLDVNLTDEMEVALQPGSTNLYGSSNCDKSHREINLDSAQKAIFKLSEPDTSLSRTWSNQKQSSFDVEQSNITIDTTTIKQECGEDFGNVLGTSEDDYTFHSDISATLQPATDNLCASSACEEVTGYQNRLKTSEKFSKMPSKPEKSGQIRGCCEEDDDETNLFFASVAKAVRKLPELLRAQIRLKVATLVGNVEIEYYSNRETSGMRTETLDALPTDVSMEVEMRSKESVPDNTVEIDSLNLEKRARTEPQNYRTPQKRLKRSAASNDRRDEVEPFFVSTGKVVKKLKDLARAKVRLKVASVVGDAEIEHLLNRGQHDQENGVDMTSYK